MASQPTPTVTARDVDRVVARDFSPGSAPEVAAILAEYGMEDWHGEKDRVRLAVLKLAGGNIDRLRVAIETAKRKPGA